MSEEGGARARSLLRLSPGGRFGGVKHLSGAIVRADELPDDGVEILGEGPEAERERPSRACGLPLCRR